MNYDRKSLLDFFKPQTLEKEVAGIGKVLLRELSAPEVSDIREACKSEEKKQDFGYHLVIAALVDERGQPVFSPGDLAELRGAAQGRFGELVTAVMEMNGFQVKEGAVKN